jgi:hypothetical protein
MSHFWLGLFGALTGSFLALGWQMAWRWRRHRKLMSDLEEVNRYTMLAQAAKTQEEYEFYFTKALEHLDKTERP